MSRSSMIVEPPFQNALRHQRHEGERCQQRGDGKGPDEIILVVENLDMQRQGIGQAPDVARNNRRSEEHTSELQSLMRISYAVFCLNKKIKPKYTKDTKRRQI